ncbi:MAG: ATP-binding protein [Paraglaciecola sp.]|uniref:ATP-binding protein n=1 Tax=Paraglaciecola sp. TaxID=1920173 RepID=UPI00329A2EED
MIRLSRFNPAKSLFFKVFLWFWLATLLIFISSIWLANQLGSEASYRPLNSMQHKDLRILTNKIQKQIDRSEKGFELKKLLNKVSSRNRFSLVLFDPATREIVHSVARSRRFKNEMFDDFNLQSSPLFLDVAGLSIVGPGIITIEKAKYMLFMVAPRPGGSLRVVRHEYPGIFILFLITISMGLCYLFVRGLLNPIAQLSLASKQMAAGEMGVRVAKTSKRLDEIGQLGRDFNYMSEQVESLLSSQKRLLADISHELRTPLTRLQLSIGIAQQQNESDMSANMLAALERIEKESLKIEEMISQVLLLSRLDNKQPIQNLESVSLEKIMTPLMEDAQFEAAQKDKKLIYQVGENISIYAEPQLLCSAIENILRNAIYYSNHLIEVSVSKQQDCVVWIIEDDGNGIEESQLDRIFEAFYRESTARDRNSGGVGLGLAIAQRAIAKHQGFIEASNKPQGGLRVKISIPYDKS